ncbi:MAG: hypothetical protein LBD04_06890 [Synergistaceae bacterium]|jgi:hypothetical protein|nr:hypothetical protein [Synergistaceae bacterium]
MKKTLVSVICLKNIVIWAGIAIACLIALTVGVRQCFEMAAKEEEVFLPGVGALFLGVSLFLLYSVSRIKKYVKLLRGAGD